jgi:putative resolvase
MSHAITLSQWANRMGLSYRTAWRMVREGKLPSSYQSMQFKTGTIRILEKEKERELDSKAVRLIGAVIYARINSRTEIADLDEQVRLCRLFCHSRGWEVERVVRERAPGFGPKRKKLHSLLVAPPRRLVVARPSVLSRFDIVMTEILLRNLGCELVVVDRDREHNGQGGALEDLTDAISATCNLHYGLKRGRLLVKDLNRLVNQGVHR